MYVMPTDVLVLAASPTRRIMHQHRQTVQGWQVAGEDEVGVGVVDLEVVDGHAFGMLFHLAGRQRARLAVGRQQLLAGLQLAGRDEIVAVDRPERMLVGRPQQPLLPVGPTDRPDSVSIRVAESQETRPL